jgi:hypothetical protein
MNDIAMSSRQAPDIGLAMVHPSLSVYGKFGIRWPPESEHGGIR